MNTSELNAQWHSDRKILVSLKKTRELTEEERAVFAEMNRRQNA